MDKVLAFIIFNRPALTEKVFAKIRMSRPDRLYVIADGPRAYVADEAARCEASRAVVDRQVDWPCDVTRIYSATNLGCRQRVISGLDEVFRKEDAVIIMEDDIDPDISFFFFCWELLERYKNREKVKLICGYNELQYRPADGSDYFFSRYTPIWGWATWKRAWHSYQREVASQVSDDQTSMLGAMSASEYRVMLNRLRRVERGALDTWDYHWRAAVLLDEGLAVIPSVNLIRNLGFGPEATHTVSAINTQKWKRVFSLSGQLKHPAHVRVESSHDRRLNRRRRCTALAEIVKDYLMSIAARSRS